MTATGAFCRPRKPTVRVQLALPKRSSTHGEPVRLFHSIPLVVLSAATFAACDNGAKQQLATLTTVDSLRTDSLSNVRKELLEEVMTSTQFVNQINAELLKAKAIAAKPAPQLESKAELSQ